MRAFESPAADALRQPGLVVCHNVHDPSEPRKILLRKGHRIETTDRPALDRLGSTPLHLLELGPEDITEDEAGQRLARAVAGPGVAVAGMSESQVRIEATERGLFRVDTGRLSGVNAHDGVTVWSLEDQMPVEPGRHVASAKVAPLAVPATVLEAAEAAAASGVLRVLPYRDRAVAILVREKLGARARARFEEGVRSKLAWFGAESPSVKHLQSTVDDAAGALRSAVRAGAELVLVGGTGSTDPLDPVFRAIQQEGGTLLRTGVPAHPGSTYWLACVDEVPVLGLASCGMFSRMTALDLLLPRFFAGEPLTVDALISLAVGGLVGKDRSYRFPRYSDD